MLGGEDKRQLIGNGYWMVMEREGEKEREGDDSGDYASVNVSV